VKIVNEPAAIAAMDTAVNYVKAPLMYKGKVRELYDLGDSLLIVVTDRISAFDYILKPAIPHKGKVLNLLSKYWFEKTDKFMANHVIHTDVDLLGDVVADKEMLRDRMMVAHKAERIDIECVVRGYITGGGWRQYQKNGQINGIPLRPGMRKNEQFDEPIFTPAAKNDVGHDEDISMEQMKEKIGPELASALQEHSLALYRFAHEYCLQRGIILADCKFEFGLVNGQIVLIDEIFTPDCSRFWSKEKYGLDIEIDSMDKEPVRTYLAGSDWDQNSQPDELPHRVVEETSRRYREILHRLTNS
jgi:phosphoribosylaminoimidazole-succinocarboxamide synthase